MQQVDMSDATDTNRALMVDGNALGGLLYELFAAEVTASRTKCGFCGKQGEIGTLLAFIEAPGAILRCPACENVLIRIVQTPTATYLDARGVVYLRLDRS